MLQSTCAGMMRQPQAIALAVLGAATATIATIDPAKAFSTVPGGTYTFTSPLTATPTNPNITFTAPTSPTGTTLSVVKINFNNLQFGGSASLGNPTGSPVSAIIQGAITLDFGVLPSINTTTTASAATLSSSTVPSLSFANPNLSGSFGPTSLLISMTTPTVRSYFEGGATIVTSNVNFSTSPNTLLANFTASQITGSFDVEYQYVPGPLPLAGAAVAFAQSRRLRQRIKARQAGA